MNVQHRKALSQLRLCAHRLRIETGRYECPMIPRSERLCEFCGCEVEDKQHVITKCHIYLADREKMHQIMNKKVQPFQGMSDDNKFNYLMICEDRTILQELAKFVYAVVCPGSKTRGYSVPPPQIPGGNFFSRGSHVPRLQISGGTK